MKTRNGPASQGGPPGAPLTYWALQSAGMDTKAHPIRAAGPTVLVLRAAGTNCDAETATAFELAGFRVQVLHFNRVLENPKALAHAHVLAIPGGFSYGDDIAAGRIWASRLSQHLREPIADFVAAGKPVIGICNGFQVLVQTDLLPGPIAGATGQTCALTTNDCGHFIDRWIRVVPRSRKCIWTSGVEPMDLPVAHGEGKLVPLNDRVRQALWQQDQVALVYAKAGMSEPATEIFPDNPNGSVDDVAGICDSTGLVFGLMPHPERHVSALAHPAAWSRSVRLLDEQAALSGGAGMNIFRNAFRYIEAALPAGV
jgi:phosphoribosylformylglycinamidine synthase subunit PurQ / glutaminase